jgi:hypothetical protein
MLKAQVVAVLTLAMTGIGPFAYGFVDNEVVTVGDALVIRLVHPDRQGAAVLDLFTGARVAHPAAALAAWKRCARNPNLLDKPLEAGIAMFNPDMAREWKVLHNAELRFNLATSEGKLRWCAVVPCDDGTLAAAVTAMRITDGATEDAISLAGREIAVERLGPRGAVVSAQIGETLFFGDSRAELVRVLESAGKMPRSGRSGAARVDGHSSSEIAGIRPAIDSGVVFELTSDQFTANAGSMVLRRFAAFLQGIRSGRIVGILALKSDCLALDVMTTLARSGRSSATRAAKSPVVDHSWLTWVPARGVMGVISVACEPEPAFWDSTFALADRIERADPSRAELAPLRTRFNLLATAAGARPEVDLWPHLRGVTACVTAVPNRPGQIGSALLVLHVDAEASAERLATHVVPRLSGLLTGKKPQGEPLRKVLPGQIAGTVPRQDAIELGTLSGRPLAVICRGRDVVIGWGADALPTAIAAVGSPDRSVAPLCAEWTERGKRAPQRLGAFWPARSVPAGRALDTTGPAWQVLAEDPPAVWWGWTTPDHAQDLVQLSGLRDRVHRFLENVPLDPSPLQ